MAKKLTENISIGIKFDKDEGAISQQIISPVDPQLFIFLGKSGINWIT